MICAWCKGPIPVGARRDALTCSKRCRQARHRFGAFAVARERTEQPLRIAYADPPYPGLSRRYYADHPDFAGEVDHRALLERLATYDGWALSTSARPGLRLVLGLVAELGLDAEVACWVRGPRPAVSDRPLGAWEPVVYSAARPIRRGSSRDEYRTDALVHGVRARTTDPARVVGAKPAAFAYWMFDLVGARPGDLFDDLFAGSGGVARAWDVYVSRAARTDASDAADGDASRTPRGGVSEYSRDASEPGRDDASSRARGDR